MQWGRRARTGMTVKICINRQLFCQVYSSKWDTKLPLFKRFTGTRIGGCSLMLAKSKSHFLFTARECVRLIKITHESSQGAKNTRPTFLYLLAYLVFTFPSKSDTFILCSNAYNFKGQKFFAKMWAKSSYYQIWTPQSTHYRVNATFSDEQRVF